MTVIFVALGAFIVGAAVSTTIGVFWFRQGFQLGRDDRTLTPRGTTGQLTPAPKDPKWRPAVGESSGPRHALRDRPERTKSEPVAADEVTVWPLGDADTEQFKAVTT